MPLPSKDKDQEKGDEVLRRLLKTPPDHRTGKTEKRPDRSERRSLEEDRENGRDAK